MYWCNRLPLLQEEKKSPLNNNTSAEHLVEQLFQCPEHSFTPKGKKIIQTLTLEEISSKF